MSCHDHILSRNHLSWSASNLLTSNFKGRGHSGVESERHRCVQRLYLGSGGWQDQLCGHASYQWAWLTFFRSHYLGKDPELRRFANISVFALISCFSALVCRRRPMAILFVVEGYSSYCCRPETHRQQCNCRWNECRHGYTIGVRFCCRVRHR